MKQLGSHPHIVSFIGCCKKESVCLLMDYCRLGDLRSFLLRYRQRQQVGNVKIILLIVARNKRQQCYLKNEVISMFLINNKFEGGAHVFNKWASPWKQIVLLSLPIYSFTHMRQSLYSNLSKEKKCRRQHLYSHTLPIRFH